MKRIALLLFAVAMAAAVVAARAQTSTGTDVKPAPQSAKDVRGASPYIEIKNEDANHEVFPGQSKTVTFTVPKGASHAH